MNRDAAAYLQNHISWCWATVAKIVGLAYCARNEAWRLRPGHVHFPGGQAVRPDKRGLRPEVCGLHNGELVVDAMQLAIVDHAKNPINNPDGNRPEDDMGKARALRYVVTGDPQSTRLNIGLCGRLADRQDLLSGFGAQVEEIVSYRTPFIGSYQKQDGLFHSVVLAPVSASRLVLYDPWDGYREQFTTAQVFQSGFLTNQGAGCIKWIQYIIPGGYPGESEV